MASMQTNFHRQYKEISQNLDIYRSLYKVNFFNFLFRKLAVLVPFESLMNVIIKCIKLIFFGFLIIINQYIDTILVYLPVPFLIKQTISSNQIIWGAFLYPFCEYIPKKLKSRHRKKLALKAYLKFANVINENCCLLADSLITKHDFKKELKLEIHNLIVSLSSFIQHGYEDIQSYTILNEFIERLHRAEKLDFDDHNSREFFMDLFGEMFVAVLPIINSRFRRFHPIEIAISKL